MNREREREKKNTPCSSSLVDATLFQESHPHLPSGRSRDGFKNSAQRRPARPKQAKICAPLFSPRNTRPDFPWDSFSDMLTSPSGCLGARVGIDYSARSVSMYERESPRFFVRSLQRKQKAALVPSSLLFGKFLLRLDYAIWATCLVFIIRG